jgi:hypothetical protein
MQESIKEILDCRIGDFNGDLIPANQIIQQSYIFYFIMEKCIKTIMNLSLNLNTYFIARLSSVSFINELVSIA